MGRSTLLARNLEREPDWALPPAAAGLPDEPIHRVERAVVERDPLILWSRVTSFWDMVRRDPRFEDVMRPVWS